MLFLLLLSPPSGYGSPEKVGRWTHAEGRDLGRGSPLLSCGGAGLSPLENFRKCGYRSVQFGAFLATSAAENVWKVVEF